jgi:TATA-box binding protein (TBP) (component of TFIID and TFIIIB)
MAMDSLSYIRTLAAIHDAHPRSSLVRITTITMCAKAQFEIDIPKIREAFADGKSCKMGNFVWSIRNAAFYNQVTLGYRDANTNKSVKLFPNGSIHVAGCSDLFDCERVVTQLSLIMREFMAATEDIPLASISVKMINTNFSLNAGVNLNNIIAHLSKDPAFKVTFTPERYSAVKIKFAPGPDMKQVTASIFSTGKIIVTGAQTLKEIAFAYKILNEQLSGPKIILGQSPVCDTFDVILGYKVADLMPVLVARGVASWV